MPGAPVANPPPTPAPSPPPPTPSATPTPPAPAPAPAQAQDQGGGGFWSLNKVLQHQADTAAPLPPGAVPGN